MYSLSTKYLRNVIKNVFGDFAMSLWIETYYTLYVMFRANETSKIIFKRNLACRNKIYICYISNSDFIINSNYLFDLKWILNRYLDKNGY